MQKKSVSDLSYKRWNKIEDTTITELLHRNRENKLVIEITAKDRTWIEIVKNYRM